MEWAQVLTVLISMFGFMLWSRNESRKDWEKADRKTDELRIRTDEISKEMVRIYMSIEAELKEYHGRMAKLEERYIQFKMNQKQ